MFESNRVLRNSFVHCYGLNQCCTSFLARLQTELRNRKNDTLEWGYD